MKSRSEYFYCSPGKPAGITEIDEIYGCISNIQWQRSFSWRNREKNYSHQKAYNKAFEYYFSEKSWQLQPKLYNKPKLIGDFQKNGIFVEVQFGNSATLYRDYYKFHYGFVNRLLSLAVLIVPMKPKEFFPTRPKSVSNMAEFDLARRYFDLLPIPVPILLLGLLPEN